jgi:hypothetical protein
MQLLGGGRGEVVDGFVRTLGVEPGDPVQGRWLEVVVPVAPGTVRMEQLGLNRPICDSARALS